jgi:hypothetical protein
VWIRTVDYVLAAAGIVGHLTLLAVLVRRRLIARLPLFAFLMVFYLLRSLLLLTVHLPRDWPRSYWLLIYLDPGLQLLVILALSYAAWPFGRQRVAVAIPLMIVVASVVAWYVGSSRYSPQNVALKLSVFVSSLWLMAAACLLLLLRRADSSSRRLSLGIALGFAAYSAANIATEIVHMHFALHPRPALFTGLSFFRAIVYLCCLAGWSTVFCKDRSRATPVLTSS